VCTVGGGDALAGGLIHALLDGADWTEALAFGMRVAGWTVAQAGCSHGFPTVNELARFDGAAARRVR
jgi:sugar/nucleoside kinase (ribokinase family)